MLDRSNRATHGLFWDNNPTCKDFMTYSLVQFKEGYPLLKDLYLAEQDFTEINFARKYMSSHAHWERLCDCEWFKPHITEWRKELELNVYASALKRIIEEAEGGTQQSFQANKFLLQGAWRGALDIIRPGAPKTKPGKPSEKEIASNLNVRDAAKRVSNDLDRILNSDLTVN